MRAVNLIPAELRRGGQGQTGRSGSAVYGLLGLLGALVIAVAAYVLTANGITDKRAELTRVQRDATAAQARAAALRPYRDFATLRQTRVATVQSLATSRFDWENVLRDLERVVPDDVWLTSFVGTVKPGVSLDGSGGGGDTGQLRSALQVPAVELIGCTTSQTQVARMLARLRLIRGVTRVSLASSAKGDSAAGGGGGGGAGGDCRNGSARFPQFQMVAFFGNFKGADSQGAAPGPTASPSVPAATQPASSSSGTGAGR